MSLAAVYDQIGGGYDATRRAGPAITVRLIHHLAPQDGGRYLDVACGTGNYTLALAGNGLAMTGVDRSSVMLDAARAKAPEVTWRHGGAGSLPFDDGVFDGALCTLAIHHFDDLTSAMAEVWRVIGAGRFVIFTATPAQMLGYWLNRYFPATMALATAQMPTLDDLMAALRRAGFRKLVHEPFLVPDDLEDLFLYAGKHRPGLYLDPAVRAGISTFAALAPADELERGLRRLAHDIRSGEIDRVIADADDSRGDYLFVIGEKLET